MGKCGIGVAMFQGTLVQLLMGSSTAQSNPALLLAAWIVRAHL
jgi:hypothetical protein